MSDLDLKHLRALCDAATPGPWVTDRFDTHSTVYRANALCGRAIAKLPYEHNPYDETDAAFIAAARTALPALIDRVDELEREVEMMRSLWDEGVAELTAAAEAQVERWKNAHDHEAKRGDHYKKQRDGAMTAMFEMFEKSEAADAYRAMLADLVFARKRAAMGDPMPADLWQRARDLLKNGPKPAASSCGVCLDGAAPCPIIDPPGVTKWTCLACGRIVGEGKGVNDE